MSAAPQLKAYLKVQVEVVQGNQKGLKVSPDKATWTIGRGPENDVILGQDIDRKSVV